MPARRRNARSSEAAPPLEEAVEDRVLALVGRYREAVTAEMRAVLARPDFQHFAPMRYHLGWEDQRGAPAETPGGKMLRPVLCLLSCQAVGGDWRRAFPAAAAVELIHNFSLVHDDVEDASSHRRGRETVWHLWGPARAINVGDGMFALAHLSLLRLADQGVPPERVLAALSMLDEACLRLCEGQHLDLTFEGRAAITGDEYLAMVEGKTAALIAASAGIGALLGEARPAAVEALRAFGRLLGMAFQVRDDLLGIWGQASETGKPAGDDILARKKSFPVAYALEHAAEADRRRLGALFEAPIGEAEMAVVVAILEEAGARRECERAAEQYASQAVAELRAVELRPARREELEVLALHAARRRR